MMPAWCFRRLRPPVSSPFGQRFREYGGASPPEPLGQSIETTPETPTAMTTSDPRWDTSPTARPAGAARQNPSRDRSRGVYEPIQCAFPSPPSGFLKNRVPVLPPLGVSDESVIPCKVDVLHPKRQSLHQAKARAIQQTADQPGCPLHRTQNLGDFRTVSTTGIRFGRCARSGASIHAASSPRTLR